MTAVVSAVGAAARAAAARAAASAALLRPALRLSEPGSGDAARPLVELARSPLLGGPPGGGRRGLGRTPPLAPLAPPAAARRDLSTDHSYEPLAAELAHELAGGWKHGGDVTPMAVYLAGVKSGAYIPDPRQEKAIALLDELHENLLKSPPLPPQSSGGSGLALMDALDEKPAEQGGLLSWLGSSSSGSAGQPDGHDAEPGMNGIYMFGGVGTGKTMLMDLFVETCPRDWQARRVHFHDFMLDVHSRLRRKSSRQDPLASVADELARGASILCLDELFVTDVADATILNRLFARLWEKGVVLVSTSNRAPSELYKGGLQRDLFLPFIASLEQRCVVFDIGAETDYRQTGHHRGGVFFHGAEAEADLKRRLRELTGGVTSAPTAVEVQMGRVLEVEKSYGRTAAFGFRELCDRPLAAADYIALATSFHTLALKGVPMFHARNRSAAYRFVTLVDVLYENKVRLLCSAEVEYKDLFRGVVSNDENRQRKGQEGGGHDGGGLETMADGVAVEVCVDDNLAFAKDRTLSRITEICSDEYLQEHAAKNSLN